MALLKRYFLFIFTKHEALADWSWCLRHDTGVTGSTVPVCCIARGSRSLSPTASPARQGLTPDPDPDFAPQAATGARAGVVVGKQHSLTWLLPGEEGPLGTAPPLHCGQWEPCGAPSIIPPPGTNLPSSGRTAAHPPAPHPCLPAPSGGSASSALSPAPASGGAERPKDECTGSCTQPRRDEDGVGAGLTCPRGDEHPQHTQPGGDHATCSR